MGDVHNNITEAAHGGYAKSYNRIASIYYWPQMSRDIKRYVGTCEIFFQHVISQYGIPRQIISDRDTRWRGDFWKEICNKMGMKRALTTAYHPQADGQTEIMNQTLEISL